MPDDGRAGAEARLRELTERGAWTEVEALAETLLGRDAQCVPALVARALSREAAAARAALAAHPDDPWARDLLMWRLHRSGDLSGAEALARGTLERWPGEAGAIMLRGLAARARNNLPEALALLRQAAEHPARRDAREALLETLRLAQEWPAAEALAEALLLEAPGLAGAVLARGLARRARGDAAGATVDLSGLPDEPAAMGALMWMRHDAGDSAAVDALAARILARAPRDHAALMLRGIAAQRRNDLPAALASFRQAHSQHPADAWARDTLMEACREAGAWADAEAAAEAALQADPAHRRARITRGLARDNRGDSAGAIADLATLPEDLWASSSLMWIHHRAGDAAAADAVAAGILAAAPEDMGALMMRGLVARERQDLQVAASFFRAASTVAPADPWPTGTLLEAYRDLGDWEGAEAALSRLDPGSATFRLGMARLRRAQGRADEAVTCLQPAMAGGGATAELAVELARALLEVNRPGEALAAAEAALRQEAGHLGARLTLATAARRLEDPARERAALEEATSLHPGRLEPVLALADLGWREGRGAEAGELLQGRRGPLSRRCAAPGRPGPAGAAGRTLRGCRGPVPRRPGTRAAGPPGKLRPDRDAGLCRAVRRRRGDGDRSGGPAWRGAAASGRQDRPTATARPLARGAGAGAGADRHGASSHAAAPVAGAAGIADGRSRSG
jgi:tetratricopeptide (TPR) repeat protein